MNFPFELKQAVCRKQSIFWPMKNSMVIHKVLPRKPVQLRLLGRRMTRVVIFMVMIMVLLCARYHNKSPMPNLEGRVLAAKRDTEDGPGLLALLPLSSQGQSLQVCTTMPVFCRSLTFLINEYQKKRIHYIILT